jgi:hypothetical protein
MRFIGLDVHRGFCEVAIAGDGKVRSADRIKRASKSLSSSPRVSGPMTRSRSR